MTYEILLALFIFTFVASVTPGPNNLMLLASGLNFGVKRTLPHMFGIAIGFMVMVLLVGSGLGQVFKLFPPLYTAMKVAGLLYMLWLAWNVANSGPVGEGATQGRPSVLIIVLVFGITNFPSISIWVFAGVGLRRFLDDPVRLRVVNITMALLLVASLYPVVIDLAEVLSKALSKA
jgi:threonine/homoserine/homoserine lactone efflux protein